MQLFSQSVTNKMLQKRFYNLEVQKDGATFDSFSNNFSLTQIQKI